MKITCIILDDEPLARKGLKEYIADVPFLELLGEFDNPLNAMEAINTMHPELVFLDIQMPKINGLDFLKSLANPPLIIFTTAYPQYAVEGFDLCAVDYLLKPFSFERFWRAVVKTQALKHEKQLTGHSDPNTIEDHFFIKADSRIIRIQFAEIVYAEALQNYVAIQTTNKKYLSYITFKTLEDHLPASQFLRIHKSYIVSLSKINSIEGNELKVASYSLPISRSLKDQVLERLLHGKFLKR